MYSKNQLKEQDEQEKGRKNEISVRIIQQISEQGKLPHSTFAILIAQKTQSLNVSCLTSIEDHYLELSLDKINFLNEFQSQDMIFSKTISYEKNLSEIFKNQKFRLKDLQGNVEKNAQTKERFQKYLKIMEQMAKIWKKEFPLISDEIAQAYALAVIFYTGLPNDDVQNSDRVNRDSNAILKAQAESLSNKVQNQQNFVPLLYYLTFAILRQPYFWGKCIRAVDLKDEDLQQYQQGNIICWIQFSSSAQGTEVPDYFKKRNTRFLIYSLYGRTIQKFSTFAEEKEVIFLPYSYFQVIKVEKVQSFNYIHIRQISLGLNIKNILWVDDNIFVDGWENKGLMEKVQVNNPETTFIPKINTDVALAYLNSEWGQEKKNDLNNFRIITDMTRDNENPSKSAGARFAQQVRKLGFNQQLMIFTSNIQHADQQLTQLGVDKKNIKITTHTQEALNFLAFKN